MIASMDNASFEVWSQILHLLSLLICMNILRRQNSLLILNFVHCLTTVGVSPIRCAKTSTTRLHHGIHLLHPSKILWISKGREELCTIGKHRRRTRAQRKSTRATSVHSGFSNVKEAKKKIPSDTSIIFEKEKGFKIWSEVFPIICEVGLQSLKCVCVSWTFEVTPKCDGNQERVRKGAVEASTLFISLHWIDCEMVWFACSVEPTVDQK